MCVRIDIQTSIEIGKKATENGIKMIDAPVSGGVMGAQKATLNIMVGGTKEAFELALPLLKIMGKNIFHAGDSRKWQYGAKDLQQYVFRNRNDSSIRVVNAGKKVKYRYQKSS